MVYATLLIYQVNLLLIYSNADFRDSGSATYNGEKVIESSVSFMHSMEDPDYTNTMSRILKNTEKNIPGAGEAYERYGLSDHIPPEGILLTIPPFFEDARVTGGMTVHIPPPFGSQTFEGGTLDCLHLLGAILPDITDWHPYGLELSRKIDVLTHKNPFLAAFSLDAGTLMDQLLLDQIFEDGITDTGEMDGALEMHEGYHAEMEEALEMPEEFDLGDLPGFEEIQGLEGFDFGDPGADEQFSMNKFNELMSIMRMPGPQPGVEFYVELKVSGIYTALH